ncbi:TrkH family potassium uptake protein [Exiguobacterium oxidotolerans]|uniref:TrkH family potassium uptake protein n=1 Tax=Exiguobacterium oxidotolerans TaxID=223958 RepID=UPI000493D98C|nr:TrkH family potassium uptake protein [Exiguobacterium oxidotolerans]
MFSHKRHTRLAKFGDFGERTYHQLFDKPARFIATGFTLTILLGGLLLWIPWFQQSDSNVALIDCLFVATSAATVTGLSPINIAESYNLWGQLILMILIQIGGLGFMTIALVLLSVTGRKIGIRQRIIIQEMFNLDSPGGTIRLVRNILLTTVILELIGMILLALDLFIQYKYTLSKSLYYGLFHAVSAFNNAGFALWGDSLTSFQQDTTFIFTISALLMIGGLGFTVIADVSAKRSFKKISLHSKLMILSLLVVNGLGTVAMMVYEWVSHLGSLQNYSFFQALHIVFFQVVTTRTAGFQTIDLTTMVPLSIGLMMVLMYIGAGSASTGSGIKVTTAAVILKNVWTYLRGQRETVLMRRTIQAQAVSKAYAIAIFSILFIGVITTLLALSQPNISFTGLFFETVSAFGTVGLSLNVTSELNDFGKGLIMFMMLLGRVGSLTILFTVATQHNRLIRYPKENMLIG